MLRPVYSGLFLAVIAYTAQVASGFSAPAPIALRANAARSLRAARPSAITLYAKTFDKNPKGEERHHPYFDAPEDKLAAAGHLSVNQPPPEPNSDFSRNHPDFDAPVERMIESGNIAGSGAAAAQSEVEPAFFDAPLDRVAAAGNLHVNEPPPEPNADFSRNHPDFDAPVEKQIAAGNIQPSKWAYRTTSTDDAPDASAGPYDMHEVAD
mmetsp:Transcript_35519/g.52151  ORF Transcript_35519/g.52151 Transcript_35519/m.52151 type:complete len:209 (+) Transcript_35519:22-648(+)